MRLVSILGLVAGIAVASSVEAAEGEILFTTSNSQAKINVPTVDGYGAGYGPGFNLRLYWDKGNGELIPLDPPAPFRKTSATASTYLVPVVVSVPGTQPGDKINVVMALEHEDYPGQHGIGIGNPFEVTLGGGEQPPALPVGINGFSPLGYFQHDYAWRVVHEVEPELPEDATRIIDAVEDGVKIVVAVETVNAGVTNHTLVRLNADGSADDTFAMQVPSGGRIKSLYSPMIMIGEFPGDPTPASVVAFQVNGQVAWTFGEAGFEVTSLTEVPGGYVAGGNGIRAMDTSGQPMAGFPEITLSPAGSRVRAIYHSPDSGSLMIGGDFEELNGEPIRYFAEVEGAEVTEGEFAVNGPVRTIKFLERGTWSARHLIITGDFTEVNGEPQAYIAGTPYGHVQIGAVPGNYVADVAGEWNDVDHTIQIWAVGRFQEVNELRRPNLVGAPYWRVVDPIGSIDAPIDGVLSVEISDDQWVKWIWGGFTRINGKAVAPLVKLERAPDLREASILADGRFNFSVFPGNGTIEASTDLETWTEYQSAERLVWEDEDQPQRFFRVRVDPQ